MQDIREFTIKDISVVCPQCNTIFATPTIAKMPSITRDSIVEADLHRVLPNATIRAALVAICPCCIYSWWMNAFAPHYFVPQLVVEAPEVEPSKKFAHAVLSGRKHNAHPLDRALLAMNGLWCARESYVGADISQKPAYEADNERWLTLAAQELDLALSDANWTGNRPRYEYMMGEILRQLGKFPQAQEHFTRVDRRSMLPYELVEHQSKLAAGGDRRPTTLPPHLVEAIFLPKPPVFQQPAQSEIVQPPQHQQIPPGQQLVFQSAF